jgi:hypothetical protein
VRISPDYAQFVRDDGTCIVQLDKALYGCIESARLWYEQLSGELISLGYKANDYDSCVFNKTRADNTQATITIHVDDLLITASSEAAIDEIIGELEMLYPNLEVHRGRVLNYIGMVFDFRAPGKVKVTMDGYVSDLLEDYEVIGGVADTPAALDLFTVGDSELLSDGDKEFFHSLTAKLLYLGKRVRPDILCAVSFLSKRVQAPQVDDMKKLRRVLMYIRGTKELGIVLEADKNMCVLAWIDASFGVHADFKSHTGTVIGFGRGPVYCKSTTQKLNTKSSTEAELVGLSDSTPQVIWTRNFLIGQGYDIGPATVFQDNQSTIALVKNGKSNSERTRHIALRFFFVSDRVSGGEIKLQYLATGQMLADILTKPLSGHLFKYLRAELLNWSDEI